MLHLLFATGAALKARAPFTSSAPPTGPKTARARVPASICLRRSEIAATWLARPRSSGATSKPTKYRAAPGSRGWPGAVDL